MLSTIRSKLLWFSFTIIFLTVIPLGIAVWYQGHISMENTYQRNIKQQVNVIEQLIGVFYEDLDNNINMMAENPVVQHVDSSVSNYVDVVDIKMTPSKNGGIEQEIFGSIRISQQEEEGLR